jgi:hypothetical protein
MLRSIYATKEDYNSYYREYRKTHAEQIKIAKKRYVKKFIRIHGYHPNKKYPEKVKARKRLVEAIKNGKLKRENCSICNSPNSHAHHDDYTKPLEVKWFCPLHHSEYHKTVYKPTKKFKIRTKLNPHTIKMTKAQLKYFREQGKIGGMKLLKERGTEYFSKIALKKNNERTNNGKN